MTQPIWDDERVARWLAKVDGLEAQLAPISDTLFAAADLRRNEAVLDVGCGTGSTTRRAFDLVGPYGRVCGVDITAPMIDRARELSGERTIEWVVDDVVRHSFSPARFDAVISRFGVMFFSDPVAAFTGLARATRPGGRLRLAVWRTRGRTPLFDVPQKLITDAFDRAGISYELEPPDTGAASLGDQARTRALLTRAGWAEISFTEHSDQLYLLGPAPYERAVEESLDFGGVRVLLAGQDAKTRQLARTAVYDGLRAYYDGTGIRLPSGYLIISAIRPET